MISRDRLPIADAYKARQRPKTTGELVSYHRAKCSPVTRKTGLAPIYLILTMISIGVAIVAAM
ncbi:MAG: hypothetical protein ACKO0Z_05015 [Betaproteobacteria bacterium]